MMLVGQAVARHRSNKAVSKSVNPRDHLGPLGSHLKAEVLEYPMIEFGIWARSVKERVRFRAILVLELVADLGDTVRCSLAGSRVRTLGPSLLGAVTRSKMSMSGSVGVGGFEKGEFEGDSAREKVAAQIGLCGADAVQLRAQEIDEAAKIRFVVQRDPLGVDEVARQRLRRAGGRVRT